jgi:hypothetical protein
MHQVSADGSIAVVRTEGRQKGTDRDAGGEPAASDAEQAPKKAATAKQLLPGQTTQIKWPEPSTPASTSETRDAGEPVSR